MRWRTRGGERNTPDSLRSLTSATLLPRIPAHDRQLEIGSPTPYLDADPEDATRSPLSRGAYTQIYGSATHPRSLRSLPGCGGWGPRIYDRSDSSGRENPISPANDNPTHVPPRADSGSQTPFQGRLGNTPTTQSYGIRLATAHHPPAFTDRPTRNVPESARFPITCTGSRRGAHPGHHRSCEPTTR